MERTTGEAYVQQQTSYGGYDDDNYDERHAEESVIAKIHLQKIIYYHILDEKEAHDKQDLYLIAAID